MSVALLPCAAAWMAAKALAAAVSPPLATACSSARVSTPVPSSLVAAIAACTAARLSAVTPVMPSKVSWVKVGAVPAAAPVITALAASARACSSGTVSTAVLALPSTTLSSRFKALPALTPVTPMSVYCAAVSGVAVLPAVPSALARMAL